MNSNPFQITATKEPVKEYSKELIPAIQTQFESGMTQTPTAFSFILIHVLNTYYYESFFIRC